MDSFLQKYTFIESQTFCKKLCYESLDPYGSILSVMLECFNICCMFSQYVKVIAVLEYIKNVSKSDRISHHYLTLSFLTHALICIYNSLLLVVSAGKIPLW